MTRVTLKGNEIVVVFNDGSRVPSGIMADPKKPDELPAQIRKAKDAVGGKTTDFGKLGELDEIDSKAAAKSIREAQASRAAAVKEVEKATGQKAPQPVPKPAAAPKEAAPKAAQPTQPAAKPQVQEAPRVPDRTRVTLQDNEIVIVFNDSTRFNSGVRVDPKKPNELSLRIGEAKGAARRNASIDADKKGELDRMDASASLKSVKELLATREASRKAFESATGTQVPADMTRMRDTVPTPKQEETKLTGVTPKPALLTGTVMTPTVTQQWLDNQFQRGAVDSIYINRASVDGMLRTNANNQKAATVSVFNSLLKAKKPGEEESPLATYLSLRAGMIPAFTALQDFINNNGGLTANAPPDVIKTADMLTRDFLLRAAAGRDRAYHAEVEQVDGANSRLKNVDNLKADAKDPTKRALLDQQFVGPMDAATMASAGLYLRRSANPAAAQWKAPVAQQQTQQAAQQQTQQAPAQQKESSQPVAKPAAKPAPEPKREIVW